jgi:glycosyltransferase involved in cell wall biosynthesis
MMNQPDPANRSTLDARRSTLTVYPLPPQLPTSPYLDQLYAPMAGLGVRVRRGRPRHELPLLLVRSGPRVLHLHFFDELTQRRSGARTAARSLVFLGLLALLRLRGVRLIWTAHNLRPHETHHPGWGFLVYRCVARWSAAIIAHSQAARVALQAYYGSLPHCTVIPHGSYIGLAGPARDRLESRAALGLPAAGRVLLNLGTLRPYKGLEVLLAAFAELPAAERGTLLIAGAAKDRAYADTIARLAASIDGARLEARFVPEAELPVYLAAADVVVLPYHELLTSGILLWAFSYARPVVAPAFGAVRELVCEGQHGFLFKPGDQEELRAALARALAHPDLGALGRSALEVAREFDWQRIAAATAACYRHALREKETSYQAR